MRGGGRGRRADRTRTDASHVSTDGRGWRMRDAIARAATAVDVELHLLSFLPSFIVCLSEERMMNGAIRRNKFPFEPPSRFTPSSKLLLSRTHHSPRLGAYIKYIHTKADTVIKLNKGGWMNLQPRGRGAQRAENFANVLMGIPSRFYSTSYKTDIRTAVRIRRDQPICYHLNDDTGPHQACSPPSIDPHQRADPF